MFREILQEVTVLDPSSSQVTESQFRPFVKSLFRWIEPSSSNDALLLSR
jgi:hypothetical protein